MKRKTPLMLMELTLMVLVFALAAGMCMQVLLVCTQKSAALQQKDQAMVRAHNAAELLKHYAGDAALAAAQLGGRVTEDGRWHIQYDEWWRQTGQEPVYLLQAEPQPGLQPLLGEAAVTVTGPEGQLLFSLTVCWQKEAGYEE